MHETAPPSRASPVVQRPHPFHWVLNLPTLTRLPKGIFGQRNLRTGVLSKVPLRATPNLPSPHFPLGKYRISCPGLESDVRGWIRWQTPALPPDLWVAEGSRPLSWDGLSSGLGSEPWSRPRLGLSTVFCQVCSVFSHSASPELCCGGSPFPGLDLIPVLLGRILARPPLLCSEKAQGHEEALSGSAGFFFPKSCYYTEFPSFLAETERQEWSQNRTHTTPY